MNNHEEQWLEDVMGSMKGATPANPSLGLYEKIVQQLEESKALIIPIGKWKYAIAAAMTILLLNILAFKQITKNIEIDDSEDTLEESYLGPIVSNYDIYEP